MREALTLPNLISVIRLLLVPVFLWLVFGADEIGWAGVLLGVIGATDWIDGYLARRLDQVSEVGKFLDPLADKLIVLSTLVILVARDRAPAWLVTRLSSSFFSWLKRRPPVTRTVSVRL